MRNKNAKVSDPNSFISDPGSPIHILYSSKVCPDGNIRLAENGKENIQDYIDSQREQTDMSFILHQLSLGNTSVINQKQMLFGDFTECPNNLAEAMQVMIDGEAAFNQLPVDTRKQFDNNFRNWLFTSGSDEWISKMSSLLPKVDSVDTADTISSEVKE